MKLQTKFFLGILGVFLLLAAVSAIASIKWINLNTIREAQHHVEVHMRAAWDIFEEKRREVHSTLEALAQSSKVKRFLEQKENRIDFLSLREELEGIRKRYSMDVLILVDSEGVVVLRASPPFNTGDGLSADPMISQVLLTGKSCEKEIILSTERLKLEGDGMVEKCLEFGGEPRGMLTGAAVPLFENNSLLGCIQMGTLLNGATEIVDRIRKDIFEDKYFNGKPMGIAAIFMGDLKISTSVVDDRGRRAIGIRISGEVSERLLEQGLPWTGRAWVTKAWYLSQYDPIKDPKNNKIGMLYIGELEDQYLAMRARTIEMVLGIIFGGFLVAFLITFMIIRNILIPIKKLSFATKNIRDGKLFSRVEVKTRDEVGNLARSYNEMAEQLAEHEQKIRQKQKELKKINRELKKINRNYMEMLGFVSHELKNPLASAVMSLYAVKDGYLGQITDNQKQGLERVAKSLDYFQDMIKNYLDLSRLEKGELEVHKKKISLKTEVISTILAGLEKEITQKKIQIEDLVLEQNKIYADRDLLRIVYDNILSNAIKYGNENGKIKLEAEEDKDRMILSVYNEGKGIPQDKIAKLFKKFSRLDSPGCAGKKGTGLGLYICREIIEKHGGKIWAESQEGKWAKFLFSLPKGH